MADNGTDNPSPATGNASPAMPTPSFDPDNTPPVTCRPRPATAQQSQVDHSLLQPIPLPLDLPTQLYGAMLAVWHLRPASQRRFPLHKGRPRDFVRFLAWCVNLGRRDYAILRAIPEWDAELNRPVVLPELDNDTWAGGFSVAMFLYGVAKHRYTFGAMLSSAGRRAAVARAFWRGQRHERFLPRPPQWQYDFVVGRFDSCQDFAETLRLAHTDGGKPAHELTREFELQDVANAFAATQEKVSKRPHETAPVTLPDNLRRSPVRLPLPIIRPLSLTLERRAKMPTQFELGSVTARIAGPDRRPATGRHPFGVNLYGHARGELGIGEDVRLVARALEANGVPFCIINFEPGANVSQRDASADHWLAETPQYAINLFCMTGIEHTRYACEQGPEAFRERYTIGLWPWELPYWPASWNHAFSLVDELWGISRHTASAYAHADCPVLPMSLPVTADAAGCEARAHFGLPDDDYLFVFSFDYNSTLSRKNPDGLIKAFQQAFPGATDARAGLVLKVSHAEDAQDHAWLRLKAAIDADPRIHLIEGALRKPQVLALYRCCDCFVSLHRAEGFGRGIVEALLLGLPAIATGFSGNMDYCEKSGVPLVNYRLRQLSPGDYPQGEGQYWAEPDTAHAAQLMREHYDGRRQSADQPVDFSPAGVGARYAQRLNQLKGQLKLGD